MACVLPRGVGCSRPILPTTVLMMLPTRGPPGLRPRAQDLACFHHVLARMHSVRRPLPPFTATHLHVAQRDPGRPLILDETKEERVILVDRSPLLQSNFSSPVPATMYSCTPCHIPRHRHTPRFIRHMRGDIKEVGIIDPQQVVARIVRRVGVEACVEGLCLRVRLCVRVSVSALTRASGRAR